MDDLHLKIQNISFRDWTVSSSLFLFGPGTPRDVVDCPLFAPGRPPPPPSIITRNEGGEDEIPRNDATIRRRNRDDRGGRVCHRGGDGSGFGGASTSTSTSIPLHRPTSDGRRRRRRRRRRRPVIYPAIVVFRPPRRGADDADDHDARRGRRGRLRRHAGLDGYVRRRLHLLRRGIE